MYCGRLRDRKLWALDDAVDVERKVDWVGETGGSALSLFHVESHFLQSRSLFFSSPFPSSLFPFPSISSSLSSLALCASSQMIITLPLCEQREPRSQFIDVYNTYTQSLREPLFNDRAAALSQTETKRKSERMYQPHPHVFSYVCSTYIIIIITDSGFE